MKNNAKVTILILAFFVVATIWYKYKTPHKHNNINAEMDEEAGMTADPEVPAEEPSPAPVKAAPSIAPAPSLPQVDEQLVQQKFAAEMHDLGTCLQINNPISDKAAPTFENLSDSLRNTFGELVSTNEDWTDTHIQLPSGEERQIRIETDYAGEDSAVKKLTYYTVNKEGAAVPIPLEKEQSEDPSDTFIASLESDGKVILREKAIRAYYPNGDEILFTEKNGRLSDLEVTNLDGRKFKCSNLDNNDSSCRCL